MKKLLIALLLTFISLNAEVIETKKSIIKYIDSFNNDDFHLAYMSVNNYLESQGNNNAVKLLNNWSNYHYFQENYKDMLKTIASNESDFLHKVGFYDKNDVSYFQINIAEGIWGISKLREMTTLKIDRKILMDNVKVAGFVALHILIYNSTIHINSNKLKRFSYTKKENLVATYNHPTKLKDNYIKKANIFLTSL